ncbi:hypothetical protein LJC53_05510 [Bacteroidales bacterium OttesenSCG-928-C03]|nr:hypothetical protein [Bacteroidales bacterium OttesenSCG-928-C03]MDL2326751.1 hypothetical protein [Bacteroidales bacterium OttesenSCG-928-A14]
MIKFNKKILYPFPFQWLKAGKGIKITEDPVDKNMVISATGGGGEGSGTTIITSKTQPADDQLAPEDYFFKIQD